MKKPKQYVISVFLIALFVMLPVCFAEEIKTTDGVNVQKSDAATQSGKRSKAASAVNVFPGLVSWLAAILGTAGITYIAIGAAAIAGGYLVYHTASTAWTYYKAYSYSKMADHAYKHINDFPNIWGAKPPTKKQFEDKCRQNMNSKSVERYIQVADGSSIAYNPDTKMLTVGDINGKDIITCFPKKRKDVNAEVSKGRWKKIA